MRMQDLISSLLSRTHPPTQIRGTLPQDTRHKTKTLDRHTRPSVRRNPKTNPRITRAFAFFPLTAVSYPRLLLATILFYSSSERIKLFQSSIATFFFHTSINYFPFIIPYLPVLFLHLIAHSLPRYIFADILPLYITTLLSLLFSRPNCSHPYSHTALPFLIDPEPLDPYAAYYPTCFAPPLLLQLQSRRLIQSHV